MASVRQHYPGASPRCPAELAPGEVVWASIVSGIENPHAHWKARRVILVEPDGYAWKTIALTTRPFHRDGTPRIGIPNARPVGLEQPGWLWSRTLCTTSGIDIADHIGWVDQALVFEAAKLAGLGGPTIKTLIARAPTPHGTATSALRVGDEVQP